MDLLSKKKKRASAGGPYRDRDFLLSLASLLELTKGRQKERRNQEPWEKKKSPKGVNIENLEMTGSIEGSPEYG